MAILRCAQNDHLGKLCLRGIYYLLMLRTFSYGRARHGVPLPLVKCNDCVTRLIYLNLSLFCRLSPRLGQQRSDPRRIFIIERRDRWLLIVDEEIITSLVIETVQNLVQG